MEIIRLTNANLQECADRAARVLHEGGVVLYPTDTLYGLGADAMSDEVVEKVFRIKGRREDKPVHAIVSDLEMAAKYGEVGESARRLARELPKGKITLIVPKKSGCDSGICRGVVTFGFRIPDNEFCIAMLNAFGGPVSATSANRSGATSPRRVEEIVAQLGAHAAAMIDLAIDAGELPERLPSGVVDLSGPEPRMLREGAVPAADIRNVLLG